MNNKAYIAGIGMVTPIGANAEMTMASVTAGISAYTISDFYTNDNQAITMACVPKEAFKSLDVEIIEADVHSEQYDHIIKMAIVSLQEAISDKSFAKPVPLILALPEPNEEAEHIPPVVLITNLVEQQDLPLVTEKVNCIHTGRAAGIQALELAYRYLYELDEDYVLIGGSDSYLSYSRLDSLDSERLKTSISMDAFVPGEGAGFILLSRNPSHAMKINESIVSLGYPGVGQEPGHLYSEEPYRGDGLDSAFKQALEKHQDKLIDTVYSSMNGENHWAKEYGVAMMRNEHSFSEDVIHEHPVDCFGDMGAATSPVLIGLASLNLFNKSNRKQHLVYCSSDNAWRSAVKLEKITLS